MLRSSNMRRIPALGRCEQEEFPADPLPDASEGGRGRNAVAKYERTGPGPGARHARSALPRKKACPAGRNNPIYAKSTRRFYKNPKPYDARRCPAGPRQVEAGAASSRVTRRARDAIYGRNPAPRKGRFGTGRPPGPPRRRRRRGSPPSGSYGCGGLGTLSGPPPAGRLRRGRAGHDRPWGRRRRRVHGVQPPVQVQGRPRLLVRAPGGTAHGPALG